MAFLTNAMRNAYSFGIALGSLPVVALVFFSVLMGAEAQKAER